MIDLPQGQIYGCSSALRPD